MRALLYLALSVTAGCSAVHLESLEGDGAAGGAGKAGGAGGAGPSRDASGGASGGPDANGGHAGAAGRAAGGNAGHLGVDASEGSGGGVNGEDAGNDADAQPMGSPAIRWLGRVDPTANGARLAWPGTGFTARFHGTGAHVTLKSGADYFEVVLDGQVSVLATQSGTHVYDLAKGLAAGEHTVTLWRRTETNAGVVEAGPIAFDGALLGPTIPSSKRLEVIGDSITVGFGVECRSNSEMFTYATENNYLTYEALTSRKLGTEIHTEAWSGIGMWRDVGGSTAPESQMPSRFLRSIPSDETSRWDFSKYTPAAVVVLLGTNDFAKGDPGQPFVDTYSKFMADLRSYYPLARFYLAVSPMLGGTRRTQQKAYLGKVLETRSTAGDTNLALLEFAEPAADAWGCGHPNAAAHAIMADTLESALSRDLGW
jgi:hypothetical protein